MENNNCSFVSLLPYWQMSTQLEFLRKEISIHSLPKIEKHFLKNLNIQTYKNYYENQPLFTE